MNNKKSKGLIFFNVIFYVLLALMAGFALYLEFFADGDAEGKDIRFDLIILGILVALTIGLFLVCKLGLKFYPNDFCKSSKNVDGNNQEPIIPEAELNETNPIEENCWENIDTTKKQEVSLISKIEKKYLKAIFVFSGVCILCFIPVFILSLVQFINGSGNAIKILSFVLVILMGISLVLSIYFISRATLKGSDVDLFAKKEKEYEYLKIGNHQIKVRKIDDDTKKKMNIFTKSLSFGLGLGVVVLFIFIGVMIAIGDISTLGAFFKLLFGSLFFVVDLSSFISWYILAKQNTFSAEN